MPVAPRAPVSVRWILAGAAVWLAGFELSSLVDGVPGATSLFGKYAVEAVQMAMAVVCAAGALRRRGRERLAWLLIAAAIAVWTLGDLYWAALLADRDPIPVPSPADIGYLGFVPLAFAGIVLLVRSRTGALSRTLAVDGITAALAAGAISAAVVVGAVLRSIEGAEVAAVATNLAYPLTDLVLLGLIVGAVALRGWRLDRTWAMLGAGTIAFWVADSAYLITVAEGTYAAPSPFDFGWTAATILYAAAAWQPVSITTAERQGGIREVLLPLGFATVGLAILVVDHFERTNLVALWLATASLAAVMVRLVMTFAENLAMLGRSRQEALTDALTGLGNRRALVADLEQRVVDADDGRPLVLALFDLDGFKHYNDSFGHPAGDALLARLGHSLAARMVGRGTAYRMGGDEFCVLLETGADVAQPVVEAAADALSDRGEGFSIGCSYGSIVLPREAADSESALRIADQRMYAAKHGGRVSAGRQSKDVLLRALAERDPGLGSHLDGVALLAERVAAALGLPPDEVEDVRHAAELHDIGKVAIPDAILHKPGPLDASEWEFIRRHTLIGERIVSAAPALGRVATLVRASHERFDGAGYPDGTAGAEIPLGARIVSVCDAFDAMVTDRTYRSAVSPEAALAELRACAGSQFDPVVVGAFGAAWAARPVPVDAGPRSG